MHLSHEGQHPTRKGECPSAAFLGIASNGKEPQPRGRAASDEVHRKRHQERRTR